MLSSAADSAVDSFYTAQEGSSVCISGDDGAVWMQDCKLDEVTSRSSAQRPSNRQKHHGNKTQRLPPSSISAPPLRLTKRDMSTAPSRAPICVLTSQHIPQRKPPPETPPACKRLCTRARASEPATPDIASCQRSFSALQPAALPPPAAQLSKQTSASPEVSSTQPHRQDTCHKEVRDVSILPTDTQQAHSSSMEYSLPSKLHSQELVAELSAGQTSPTAKPQVHTCQSTPIDAVARSLKGWTHGQVCYSCSAIITCACSAVPLYWEPFCLISGMTKQRCFRRAHARSGLQPGRDTLQCQSRAQ